MFLAENRAYSKLNFHVSIDLEDVVRASARALGIAGALVYEAPNLRRI